MIFLGNDNRKQRPYSSAFIYLERGIHLNILIVDDEKEIAELIYLYLEREQYHLWVAHDGEEALKIMEQVEINLLIIDLMMPKMDGYQVIKELRKHHNIPVIIISAKNEGYDKVLGLDLGADDYVTKPFDPLELVARVKAQLRRYYQLNHDVVQKDSIIHHGEFILNKDNCSLEKSGKIIELTAIEYKILELFMANPNKVFTKDKIFEMVWGDDFLGDDNTLMVHMSNLRDKIGNDSKSSAHIKTIRGLGYTFKVNDEN